MTLALGTRLTSSGSGGNITPIDPPILRRDLLQEDDFFVLLEDGTSKIVLSLGTYDIILLEDGVSAPVTESVSSPGRFILTVN